MNDRPKSPHPGRQATLVSVVLPVYNEAQVLPELLRRVSGELTVCGVPYEIVFVNDGSQDASPRILDRLARADRRVRVVHLSRNFGHQAAVQAGLAHCQGDAVVLMDSDMQDAPEAIGQFLAQWRAGYDVVYAIRTQRQEHLLKRLLFAAFHGLMSRVATVPLPAEAGIFGLIDRRVARHILALAENDRYFPGLRGWVGFRQTGIVVRRNARYDQTPRVSLRGLVRLAKTAMFSFSTLPLAIFHAIGGAAMLLFLGLSCFSLYCKLFTELAIPGWTSYVLIGSFFGALNALGISILGEYVTRIYDQVRGRPLYLVDRTVNMEAGGGEVASDDLAGDRPYQELMDEAESLLEAAGPAQADDAPPPVLLPIRSTAKDEGPTPTGCGPWDGQR
jgi:dolichol-phosphate mannosyltransferase